MQHRNDKRAIQVSPPIKNVVVLAVGEEEVWPSFGKHARLNFSLAYGLKMLFKGSIIPTRLIDTPFLNCVAGNRKKIAIRRFRELVIRTGHWLRDRLVQKFHPPCAC